MTDYLDLTTEANVLPTIIAASTLGALSSNMALLGLVSRDFDNEFKNEGQTVTVGVRGSLSVNDKSEGSDVTVQAPTMIFPTHVGMNRTIREARRLLNDFPHTRGDEPQWDKYKDILAYIFPTHVGMNQLTDL